MHVIATAGHVDHGKSTLVKALTGHEPDRLREERRRGLSIELGYCWTSLSGVGEVAFVDVPGHERFISTMLAGVGPVPAVLFVVAADDPWMPQAAEHLAALHALDISRGVVAVTRSDLADPRAASERVRGEFRATSFGDVDVVAVSGRTGTGLGELRAALVRMLQGMSPPDAHADVRLWVDRRFHIKGSGTVVTGTLQAGGITVGDRLATEDGSLLRVRALQSLGREVREVTGTARVALSLAGGVPDGLTRGSALVTPDAWRVTVTLDIETQAPTDGAVHDDRLPAHPLLHIGTSSVGAHCRPLGADFARLTLERPLPLRVADRVLLRDPGSRTLWGAMVVDPDPPPLERRGAAHDRVLTLAAASRPPSVADEIHRRGVVRRSRLRQLGYDVQVLDTVALGVGDWLLDTAAVASMRERLDKLVEEHDQASPLDPGLSCVVAARRLGLPSPDLVAPLVAPPLRLEHSRVVRGGSTLPSALLGSLDLLAADLAADPFKAPSADQLSALGLDGRSVAAAARAGRLLRLADGVVLLPDADRSAVVRLSALPQPFTVSEARRALASSRRVVLPLLAHLDRLGLTQRLQDDRRRVTPSG